jgi:hypothetical protein
MRIKRATFNKILIAAIIAVLAGALIVGMTLAQNTGVNIVTPPSQTQVSVYMELNGNGLNDPEEFVGIFDVYSGDQGITFSWPSHAFGAGANGSYRVALLQNMNPLGAAQWAEMASAHHWASNPNGTSFTMGPFNAAYLCRTCPTRFVVQPETYSQFYDPTTDTYEYEYTPVAGAYTAGGAAALTQSDDFVIDLFLGGLPDAPEKPKKNNCEPEPIDPETDCDCVGPDLVCVDSCGNETVEPEACPS